MELTYLSADALNAGINDNGLLKNTAEHYYQVKPPQNWTDETMQGTYLIPTKHRQ